LSKLDLYGGDLHAVIEVKKNREGLTRLDWDQACDACATFRTRTAPDLMVVLGRLNHILGALPRVRI